MQDFKGMALRGGLAKLLGQGGIFALRLTFMMVVARLLQPEDFGLVAMATIVTAVLELFASAGLSMATVQKSTIDSEQISTLFWINLAVGLLLGLLCLLVAPLIVAFYREPRLLWIMVAMGVGFIFSAAGVQHVALLQRSLRYTALAAIEFFCQLTSLGIGICFAIAGYGYWALVAAAISMPAAMTACVWRVSGWIPHKPRFGADVGSLLHFGGTVTVNGVISYMTYNFDKFILGRVWGADQLGHYGVASQLLNLPTSNINTAVGGVMFSVLSRLQNDPVSLRSYFLKAYSLIIGMTLPITIFSALFAEDVVAVILGPQWSDAAVIFRLLAPAVLIFGLINPVGWLLWSIGKHTRSLQISLAIAPLVIGGCMIGLPYGPQGVAIGFSSAMAIWLIPHVVWCLHGTAVTPLQLARTASRPLLSAAVAVALTCAALPYLPALQSPLYRLAQECTVIGVIYMCMLLFVMGQKRLYLDLIKATKRNYTTPASVYTAN